MQPEMATQSEILVASLRGIDDFLVHFVGAIVMLALFLFLYVHVTPYREIRLIREGNQAAAYSLSGAVLGFVIPLAIAVAQSVSVLDMLLWAAVALVIQLVAFMCVKAMVPNLPRDIPDGKLAQGLFVGAFSLGIGILNAACMTY